VCSIDAADHPLEFMGSSWGGVTMSEDIEHPGPVTSPFDVFLDRLHD
jgi:hypothetical protein